MPTQKTISHINNNSQLLEKQSRSSKYYGELGRITATLLVGILALMTFLMLAGLQRPAANFELPLYLSIVTLGLSLVLYAVGNFASERLLATSESSKNSKSNDKKSDYERALVKLKAVRFIQQAVFILSVIVVVWFAVSVARIFFAPPAAPQGVPQSSGQEELPSEQPAPQPAP